jgi:cardiolipin synthase
VTVHLPHFVHFPELPHLARVWPMVVALGTVWGLLSAVVILLQRRSPAATIAWLLVLVLLPGVGLVLYRIVGPLRLVRKRLQRRVGRRLVDDAVKAMASLQAANAAELQVARVPIAMREAPPLHADAVDLYVDGVSAYAALLEAIAAARHHVHLEYYIYEPDQIGTRVRDLLIEKARAGVKVRLLVDGAGSARLRERFLRPLRAAGAEVAWFNPVSLRWIRTRRADFRSHRKIVVCDGAVAFTGGMNIADAQSADLASEYWRDTHLRITGAAVLPIQRVFLEDWLFATTELAPQTPELFPMPTGVGRHVAQIVASGPDHEGFPIHDTFFTVITRAVQRLWLTTPYFVPGEAIVTALCTAAMRGVDVRLIIPVRSDSRLIDLAARSYVPDLLAGGVKVYEYLPRFVHAKTIVVDDDLAVVGTANLDTRSFRLNFELAVLLYDEPLTARLAAAFETDLAQSRPIAPVPLAQQKLVRRLGEASARLLSPLL